MMQQNPIEQQRACAQNAGCSAETEAAIALALHLHLSECIHDAEPYVITIRPSAPGGWRDKSLNLRKIPIKQTRR